MLDPAAVAAYYADEAIDIVFHCAGVLHGGTVLTTSDDDLDFAWALNVKAMSRTCRAVLPGMIARGGGAIINTAPVASSVKGVADRYAYGVTRQR